MLTAETIRLIIKNLLIGINYLHSIEIAHRDLKPENILLKDLRDPTQLIISDFGMAEYLNNSDILF